MELSRKQPDATIDDGLRPLDGSSGSQHQVRSSSATGEVLDQLISAQSQVLDNEDLLNLIFALMGFQTGNERTRVSEGISASDVLKIALTCQKFFNPAINVLWRLMVSWAPLLRLIPSVVERNGILTTDGAILKRHLDRFMLYAKRIMEFDFTSPELTHLLPVSPHVYALLTQHQQLGNITFPILQKLTVDLSLIRPGDVHILFLLSSSTLSRVLVKGVRETEGYMAASFLHIISIRSPMLVGLSLQGYLTDDTLDFKHVHIFKQLRNMAINFRNESVMLIRPKLLAQLASLQNLTNLSLNFNNSQFIGPAPANTFNALETLEIGGPMHTVDSALRSINVSYLNRLDVTCTLKETTRTPFGTTRGLPYASRPDLLRSCVQAIVSVSPSIESINIVSHCRNSLIPNSLFLRFMSCTYLRRLSICLDIVDVKLIALLDSAHTKWPNMEHLGFYTTLQACSTPPLLLSEIEEIMRFFPNLITLSLPISFKMNNVEIGRMEARIGDERYYTLQELHLKSIIVRGFDNIDQEDRAREFGPENANFEELLIIGLFIDHLFPCLDRMSAESWYVDSKWLSGLEKGVKVFQSSRRRGQGQVAVPRVGVR